MLISELSGPDVVIIDDTDREVESLKQILKERNIKYKYLKVDHAGDPYDFDLTNNVKLIFLDLNYSINFGSTFQPHFCAELIGRVIPVGRQYYLVAWTKDPDKTEEVISALKEINLAPIGYLSKLKEKFRTGDEIYDIDKLLEELDNEFNTIKEEINFYGEIIDVEENQVIVNCLLNQKPQTFQTRRFNKSLLENYIDLIPGKYLLIKTISKPGSRVFEFINVAEDLRELFKINNSFKGLENTSFFREE